MTLPQWSGCGLVLLGLIINTCGAPLMIGPTVSRLAPVQKGGRQFLSWNVPPRLENRGIGEVRPMKCSAKS